jgi:hypothetical protein
MKVGRPSLRDGPRIPHHEETQMDWLTRLRQEASAIATAPVGFAVSILVAIAVIWGALHWSYQAVLSSKNARIAQLERRVAEYRNRLGGGTPEDIARRIEALEMEVKALRLRLQPRHLSAAQRQAILDRSRLPAGARPHPLTIVREENCSDCEQFAADLAAALRDSQAWIVSAVIVSALAERPSTGLGIRVVEPLRPPSEAVRLQNALRSAGLAYTTVGGGVEANVELLVAERLPQ